jgi:acyl dehydratase
VANIQNPDFIATFRFSCRSLAATAAIACHQQLTMAREIAEGLWEAEARVRYLEDLNVGDKASFGSYQVTRDEVLDFARKYDPQPFHLSDDAAARTHFGRLAASGWHTCAMTMAMLVENLEAYPQAGLGSPGVDELRWLKPVYPGDTLRVESEIVDVTPSRSKPDLGSFRSQVTVFNQDDVPVMRFISIVLIRRQPPA